MYIIGGRKPAFVGAGASSMLLGPPGLDWCFSFSPGFSKLFGAQSRRAAN